MGNFEVREWGDRASLPFAGKSLLKMALAKFGMIFDMAIKQIKNKQLVKSKTCMISFLENKSMMHTHASGCHKRRSLPAHSLAAAGLSLLFALSFPLTVRADANFSTEEAIKSFYTIDKISQFNNRSTIKTSYSLNYEINENYNLENDYNIDDPIIEYKPNYNINTSTLIVDNNYKILDDYTDVGNYIVTNGTLEVSSKLTNIKSLVMYGGTKLIDYGTTTGEGSKSTFEYNISFKNNSNIIVDATNNKYDSSLGHVVIYNGYLDAKNSNLTFKLNPKLREDGLEENSP